MHDHMIRLCIFEHIWTEHYFLTTSFIHRWNWNVGDRKSQMMFSLATTGPQEMLLLNKKSTRNSIYVIIIIMLLQTDMVQWH